MDLLNDYRSADLFDSVAVAIELETQANIALAREKAKKDLETKSLTFTGECHYCKNSVSGEQLFCDDECRAEWVEEQNKLTHLRNINAHLDVREYA